MIAKVFTSEGWIIVEEPTMLERIITIIADALEEAPHPALIYAASYVMVEFTREDIPDWIAALAGGNPDNWDAVLDEVRRLKYAEEES